MPGNDNAELINMLTNKNQNTNFVSDIIETKLLCTVCIDNFENTFYVSFSMTCCCEVFQRLKSVLGLRQKSSSVT